ncbi:MAG: DUF3313 family protein [Woeseiaceae bacterium]
MSKYLTVSKLRPALALSVVSLAVGCTTGPATIDTSPGADVTFDGLYEVRNSSADVAWGVPGLDLSGYTKIKLEGAGIEYRPGGESGRTTAARSRGGPYIVTEEQKTRFRNLVQEVFREELAKSQRFSIVDEVGPDVLLIRGAILDVVSYVPQDAIGRVDIYLSTVAEATLVVELRDSITNAILARAIDRRAAENTAGFAVQSNRVTNAAEVRRVVRRWAQSLRSGLEGFAN